jgi:hypothetical protein
VVAVHGGLEDPHHPGQGLDRLLHAGAEPPGLGQQDPFDVGHLLNATGTPPPRLLGPVPAPGAPTGTGPGPPLIRDGPNR